MTALDFFYSLAFPNLIRIAVNVLVFALSVYIGGRVVGIRRHAVSAVVVAIVVLFFSLIPAIVPIDSFFLYIIVGVIGLYAISKVYAINLIQSLFVLVVSVIVYIVLQAVLVPVILGSV